MDWITYLFRFDGRINRALLWQALLIVALLAGLLGLIGQVIGMIEGATTFKIKLDFDFDFGLDGLFAVVDPRAYRELSSADRPTLILKILGTALFLWIFLATAIKRLHDRTRSGWWIIPFFFIPNLLFHFSDLTPDANWFVPIDWGVFLLWLWGLVEMFLLRGTPGTNRFGPDPLADAETDAHARAPGWEQQREIELIPPSAGPPGGMRRA
ncbi:DUF805 domain-containing protein [Bradyrhizobium guangdongense]|uniref:DUF805 domain-containing protein n=1 Tax=Bradyrhizobium guangdongense TaxID=1325090 RepID=UPI00112E05F0|nr:DUF805 domain-containing protein [Bradyrhizobium guangdongense]TPQ26335.1 DUF805 domain-containing protein [Bradyrhizobium guangdongense]